MKNYLICLYTYLKSHKKINLSEASILVKSVNLKSNFFDFFADAFFKLGLPLPLLDVVGTASSSSSEDNTIPGGTITTGSLLYHIL
jgi:hypothetical protein